MPSGNGLSRRRPDSEAYLCEIARSLQMQGRHLRTATCWSKAAAAMIEYAMEQEPQSWYWRPVVIGAWSGSPLGILRKKFYEACRCWPCSFARLSVRPKHRTTHGEPDSLSVCRTDCTGQFVSY
jgi:hypothetical protein